MKILHSKFVLAAVALCIAMGVNAQPKFNANLASKLATAELVQPQLKFNPENAQPQKAVKTGVRKADGWTSVGTGSFTDGILVVACGGTASSYDVTVEKNDANANLYRVVEPFGASHPSYSAMSQILTYESGVYLQLDITDPANVTISEQSTGWTNAEAGLISVTATGGVLSKGVVTFNNTATILDGAVTGSLTITLPDLKDAGWTNLGKGECIESILYAKLIQGGGPISSNITVYQNQDNANVYRFAPFGTEYSQLGMLEYNFTSTDEGYVTIDITDPDNITIEKSSIGWNWSLYGQISMSATGGKLDKYGVVTFANAYLYLGTSYTLPGGFSVTLPDKVPTEAWTEWAPFMPKGDSTGVYTNTFFKGSQNNPIAVYNRYDENMPEKQQFKFRNWGDTASVLVDLILDYNSETGVVSIPKQETGYTHASYGTVYISTSTGAYNAESGLFTLPVSYFVSAGSFTGPFDDQMKMNGFADYSFSITLGDFIEDEATSVATQKFYCTSVDGTKFRYTVAPSTSIASEADIATIAKALTGEYTNLTTTEGSVQVNAENLYYIIVSSYNDEDKLDSYQYATFFYSPTSLWTSLGMCDYTDDIASAVYGQSLPICTYKVEVQESNKYAGLYRLKNPYGATFPYHGGKKYYRTDVYMYINATNPAQVQLTYPTSEQMLGADWGDGEMKIQMLSGYNNPGTMVDGVITFPQGGTGKKTPFLTAFGTEQFYGNYSGKFKVVLPRDTVTVTAAAGKATFYSDYNTIVPAGYAKTYTYNAGDNFVQEDTVLKANSYLPANTGIVFEPAAEVEADTIYTFIHTSKAATGCTSALSGVVVETAISDFTGSTIYTLANGTNGLGLYPFTGETLAAHKAFLAVPLGADVKFIALDQETGINSVKANANFEGTIFNLAGQRVEKLQKGVNIVNGKKVLY